MHPSGLIGPISTYNGRHKDKVSTIGGKNYSVQIVEEFSRVVFVRLIELKSEATEVIIDLIKLLQTQTGRPLKRVHCDGGGEFINNEFKSFLQDNGTDLNYTTAHKPCHNGIAERMNGVLQELSRSMIANAKAPIGLWGESMLYAAFIHNSTPQPVVNHQIPFSVLFGKSYDSSKFRVFGCDAFIYRHDDERGKFDSRYEPGIFVGYDLVRNGFRILEPGTAE